MDVSCEKCMNRTPIGVVNQRLACLECVLEFCTGQKQGSPCDKCSVRGCKGTCQAGDKECECGAINTSADRQCPQCLKASPKPPPKLAPKPAPIPAPMPVPMPVLQPASPVRVPSPKRPQVPKQKLCEICNQPYKSTCHGCFWKCEACTLTDNPKSALECAACGAWRCKHCDIQNEHSVSACINCRKRKQPNQPEQPTCPNCHSVLPSPIAICEQCAKNQLLGMLTLAVKELFNKATNNS